MPCILNYLFLFLWTRCLEILSWRDGSEFVCASYGLKNEWGASGRSYFSFFKITCCEILFCKIIGSCLFIQSGEERQSSTLFYLIRMQWGSRGDMGFYNSSNRGCAKSELAGVRRFSLLPLWVLEVRDFGSNRCPITAIMKTSHGPRTSLYSLREKQKSWIVHGMCSQRWGYHVY